MLACPLCALFVNCTTMGKGHGLFDCKCCGEDESVRRNIGKATALKCTLEPHHVFPSNSPNYSPKSCR